MNKFSSLLTLGLIVVLLGLSPTPSGSQAADMAVEPPGGPAVSFDPLQLNIRMSPTSLRPPSEIVKQAWTLDGYRLGRLGLQAPRAAIIDDDAHRRLLILSAAEDGAVSIYRVGDLPVDVGLRLRPAAECARARQCQNRRMDPAGELGCLALCLLESLKE
jgi:hypothetical protein